MISQTNDKTQKLKIVFLGDSSVGKTSIIERFINDDFTTNQQPTIGIDFISKNIEVDNQQVRLQLWDTAWSKRFRSLLPSYIRDSLAVIICYDITNEMSFSNVQWWINEVRNEKDDEFLIYILGNKIDLENGRKVATDAGVALAQQLKTGFFELSAKSSFNVAEFFKKLAMDLLKNQSQKAKQSQPLLQQPSLQQQEIVGQNIPEKSSIEQSQQQHQIEQNE